MNTHYDITDVRALLFFAVLLILASLVMCITAIVNYRAREKRRALHDRLNGPHFRNINSPHYRTHK